MDQPAWTVDVEWQHLGVVSNYGGVMSDVPDDVIPGDDVPEPPEGYHNMPQPEEESRSEEPE